MTPAAYAFATVAVVLLLLVVLLLDGIRDELRAIRRAVQEGEMATRDKANLIIERLDSIRGVR
jgi:hypothetical protein